MKQAVLRDVDAYESEADMTGDSDSDVDADESKSAHGKRPRKRARLAADSDSAYSSSDAEGGFKESEKVWVHVACALLSPDVRIRDHRHMQGIYMKSDLPRVPCPSTPIDAPPASPSVVLGRTSFSRVAEALRRTASSS